MRAFVMPSEVLELANEANDEVLRAQGVHAPMHSPHEAYSVILEEVDEFWDEVKAFNLPKGRDTRPKMRAELIQIAAMCIRTIRDLKL